MLFLRIARLDVLGYFCHCFCWCFCCRHRFCREGMGLLDILIARLPTLPLQFPFFWLSSHLRGLVLRRSSQRRCISACCLILVLLLGLTSSPRCTIASNIIRTHSIRRRTIVGNMLRRNDIGDSLRQLFGGRPGCGIACSSAVAVRTGFLLVRRDFVLHGIDPLLSQLLQFVSKCVRDLFPCRAVGDLFPVQFVVRNLLDEPGAVLLDQADEGLPDGDLVGAIRTVVHRSACVDDSVHAAVAIVDLVRLSSAQHDIVPPRLRDPMRLMCRRRTRRSRNNVGQQVGTSSSLPASGGGFGMTAIGR
mmetsp:Transcript_26037/g.72653  ORF Transcript_26037/g.72653 Transcript_26037/m.72653 type:complete len:304 (-) Transcript_26037:1141-2052(-)